MAFGFSEILKWGLARLTGQQRANGGVSVVAQTSGGVLLDASGANVATLTGVAVTLPGSLAVTGAIQARVGGGSSNHSITQIGAGTAGISLNGSQVFLATDTGSFGVTVNSGLVAIYGNRPIGIAPGNSAPDVFLQRGGPNILEQRGGNNAQTYRLERAGDGGANRGYTDIRQDATAGFILDSVNTGTVGAPTNLLDVQGNGTSRFSVSAAGVARSDSFFVNSGAGIATWFNNAFFIMAAGAQVAIAANVFRFSSGVIASWASGATDSNGPDFGIGRNAAGVGEINNGTAGQFRDLRLRNLIASGTSRVIPVPVGSLPSASASGAGAEAIVNDALSPAWGATVAGGGAVTVGVRSDGTNWIVF